jgi:general secretion pathway protein D
MNLIVRVLLVVVAAGLLQFDALAQRLPPDPGRTPTPATPPSGPGIAKDGKTPPRTFAPAAEEGNPDADAATGGDAPDPAAPPSEDTSPKNTVEATAPANIIKISSTGITELSCHKLGLNDMVSLDFKEMPLDDLIRLMSCWTDKNFLLTQGFQGKTITLMSPQPVTVAEAYKAFLSVLRAHQLTVAPSGKFLRIVAENTIKQEPIPLLKQGAGVPSDERMVTKIVKLSFVPASELSQILGSFKGKAGEIITYGEDTLIITDAAVMVRKLIKFVDELDQPTDKEKYWIRPVQYAEATELIDVIQSMFGDDSSGGARKRTTAGSARNTKGRRGAKSPASAPSGPSSVDKEGGEEIKVSKVLADERTNQLLIVCNSGTYMQVDKLLRKIDVPIPGEGQIHIYYLENADADELASTLSSLASGSSGGRATPRGGASSPRAGAAGGGGGGVAGLFEGEVKITSHQQTNSLIVEASLKDYLSLKKVVEKLDIRRKQVYVEAIIMEITSTKDRKFGISGSAGTTFDIDGETVPLLMGLGGLGVSGLDMQQLLKGGLATGLQGPLVDVSTGSTGAAGGLSGDLSIPSFGFLIQAIASNSDVNILSTPHILTTDNEEAEIQVGKQIPYRASSLGGLGGLSSLAGMAGLGGSRGTSSSALSGLGGLGMMGGLGGMMGGLGGGMVQRIDVDLTLKITPHVNESNYVRLEIEQSIDDVESIDRELGPTTSKRRVKNTVVVRDQQPVVIGGLIRETESEGVDKVPFLGDIPLIGILFRKNVTKTEKKNLLMVIVPHIIDDPSDLARIHKERTEEIKRFAEYLATKGQETKGIVDYEKKNGALEHMRRVVETARGERTAKERAEFEGTAVDLVGPPESHELEFDPTKQPGSETP